MARVPSQYTRNWTRKLAKNWEAHVAVLEDFHPTSVLELGVWEGRSSQYFLDHVLPESGCWVGIDPWEIGALNPRRFPRNEEGEARVLAIEQRAYYNLAKYGARATIIKDRSCDALRLRSHPALQVNNFDVAYIDGVHHSLEILIDAALVWPLVRVGGVIVFDDYKMMRGHCQEDVRRGVDAFLAAAEGKFELLFKNNQVGLRKTADITHESRHDDRQHALR